MKMPEELVTRVIIVVVNAAAIKLYIRMDIRVRCRCLQRIGRRGFCLKIIIKKYNCMRFHS